LFSHRNDVHGLWAQGTVPREKLAAAQLHCKQLEAAVAEHAAATVSTQAAAAAVATRDAQLEDAHRRLVSTAAEAGLVGSFLRGAAAELFAASQEAAELRIALADSVPRASVEFERRVGSLSFPTQLWIADTRLPDLLSIPD
jgi:hypothetical protein